MLNGFRDFTVKMVAGANVATVVFMLLVGYSDSAESGNVFPHSAMQDCSFRFFFSLILGFLLFWVALPCQVCPHSFLGLPGQLRTCPPVYAGQL